MRLRRTAAALASAVLALSACAPSVQQPPAPAQQADRPAKAAGLLKQTAEQMTRTWKSLRQLDDMPMYEMTYHGGYDAEAPLSPDELARDQDGWACSLFVRKTAKGLEYGRNFDWNPNPAMVVRADPPDGYASLSVVDVFYVLGDRDPADLTLPSDRRRLAHAVLAPFDGMNEKGLAIGLASTPTVELPPAAGKPTVSDLRIIRLVLDRAATVDEAVALMRRYTLDFGGGPQVHYLIADRTGRSVVVEYDKGGLNVVEDKILTNITMIGTQQSDRLADRRYRTLAEGLPTGASGMELLGRVAQGHTRWSIVYDLERLTADLVTIMRWERVHKLTLAGAT
ncbi:linear amide C-N hydrolase [Nonomuraea soli]|uniref:Choloylglycine hydrolase/NAAA C-terminal domain-containing protein n=1 Tax=Nonomuraea soli TaxID=1032476 RepID=A0A7W0HUJ4_9ACTN|nr:linear amide C-N hydrolase [Nonomuraea soli]MBA2896047.1 hypothetical protein [Nonomuraea soli]